MSFLSSLDISASGLTASRLRMDLISENIANSDTTRTQAGGPYRRKMAVYEEATPDDFRSAFESKLSAEENAPKGVKVAQVVEDQTPFTPVYNPEHPDADANGYVMMPNVDISKEIMDMMSVTRAYEANLTALNAVKTMASKALELGR
ncbi:MAG: flagellar basal body rod protein FlgC [Bacillota bacterium]|nr:flagellar basal body rod protein FlgC [Bacillota bacterium]